MTLITRSSLVAVAVLSVLAGFGRPLYAFDNSRKGFVLELGLGAGAASAIHTRYRPIPSYPYAVTLTPQTLQFAVNTRSRIGVGLTDRWMLTYVNDVAWTDELHPESDAYSDANLFGTGLTGLGATYFLKPDSPSWTLEAAVGIANVAGMEEGSIDSGFGAQFGVGYEFARRWMVRSTACRGWYGDIEDRTGLALSISRLWY